MSELSIIDQINQSLPGLLPDNIQVEKLERVNGNKDKGVDVVAQLKVNGKPISMAVEVKDTQSLARLRQAAIQVKDWSTAYKSLPTVSGMFLGERARNLLKSEGVNYFDLAGNIYLNTGDVYIEKIVDKNPFTKKTPLQNLFAPKSSRISRALLVEPKRRWKLQEIADSAEVSLSQAFKVVERLIDEEFVGIGDDGKYSLLQFEELLKEWSKVAAGYPTQRFAYYSFERDYANRLRKIAEQGSEQNLQYAISFFTGTDLIAPFIRGIVKTQFYIANEGDLEAWQQVLELKPVESGANVEMYIPYDEGVFYKLQEIGIGGEVPLLKMVNNIQLYLDVVNSPARGAEQAQYLLENKLLPEFKT